MHANGLQAARLPMEWRWLIYRHRRGLNVFADRNFSSRLQFSIAHCLTTPSLSRAGSVCAFPLISRNESIIIHHNSTQYIFLLNKNIIFSLLFDRWSVTVYNICTDVSHTNRNDILIGEIVCIDRARVHDARPLIDDYGELLYFFFSFFWILFVLLRRCLSAWIYCSIRFIETE